MSTQGQFNRERIEQPGRFAITIEVADDLTTDEILRLEAAVEAQVCLLQRHKRGYRPEHLAAWQSAA
jgi:hypothetical protein